MDRTRVLLSVMMLLSLAGVCYGEHDDLWGRKTLTNGFFGLNDELADSGIELGLSATQIYQHNVRGGISTHRRAGRYSGSYDFELSADLQKLLGFESGSLLLHLEGGWPDTEGIDGPSVGSAFGVNADAIGNRTMDIKQLFYEGLIFDDKLTLMIGKIDLPAYLIAALMPIANALSF